MKRVKRYGVTDQVLKLPGLEHFDVDILCEILSRVPARSLVRSCKFVCKRWLSLIRSPHFVESHRIQSQTRRPSLIITTTNCGERNTKLFSVEDGSSEVNRPLATILKTFAQEHMHIMSSNGLFCVIDSIIDSIRIYNPCTGEITPFIGTRIAIEQYIGETIRMSATYGFGFDPSTKKHKVVRVCVNKGRFRRSVVVNICEVLSTGEDNTWRMIDEAPPCISRIVPAVSVNGSIYWMKCSGHSWYAKYEGLVAFDVGSETFREISIPKSVLEEIHPIKLLEVDGCIAILQRMCAFEVKLWIFNGNWIEEIISMPSDRDGTDLYNSIHILGTEIIILKAKETYDAARNFISLYHYDRKKKTLKKVNTIGFPALMVTPAKIPSLDISSATRFPLDYGFFTIIETLSPVQKKHNLSNV
ncbi:hypothetical protein MKW92_003267 [Papaver armeniacum]|nr:hypothetical protein MKW92_003267 [Papaver armeniacum]